MSIISLRSWRYESDSSPLPILEKINNEAYLSLPLSKSFATSMIMFPSLTIVSRSSRALIPNGKFSFSRSSYQMTVSRDHPLIIPNKLKTLTNDTFIIILSWHHPQRGVFISHYNWWVPSDIRGTLIHCWPYTIVCPGIKASPQT